MYPVSKVLDRRTENGKVQFLVRRKNYSSKYDSWVEEKDVNRTVKDVYSDRNQGKL